MASTDGKSLDGDDSHESPANETVSIHASGYSGMPMHMYPFPLGSVPAQPLRSKRRQVKNACTNCQKACKKCDDARPCLRCVKYGIAEECVDSQRKERKKGIKRGPYKKRDGKDRAGSSVEQIDASEQQGHGSPISNNGMAPLSGSPPMGSYLQPVAFPGFYGQYPATAASKPGETAGMFYFAPVPAPPPPPHGTSEGETHGYSTHLSPQYYPPFVPYHQSYPPYIVHARPDGTMAIPGPPYAYGAPMYQKPASIGSANSHENMRGGVHEGGEASG